MTNESMFFRQLKNANNDDQRAWLITKRLLDSLPENLRELVYVASVSQWFDKNVLRDLCPKNSDSIEHLYADLIALPFVEPFGDRGYNIHELTRRLILDFLWKEKRDLFTDLSNRAYEYFKGRRFSLFSRNFWWNDSLKRFIDVIGSLLGMIVLMPFFLSVAVLIRREGAGPIFYRGPRIGKDGRPFGILKFRTMRERLESYNGPRVTTNDDEKFTPLGRWLRDTHLNELPQLWNVLVGEMSFVGPRPEDPEIAMTWSVEVRKEILSVRPGIISAASIIYRDVENLLPADKVMDAYFRVILPDRLRLDRLYVRNHSIMGDLDILLGSTIAFFPYIASQPFPQEKNLVEPLFRSMSRYISWFVVDLVISALAVTLTGSIWRLFEPISWGILPLIVLAFILAVLFSGMNEFLGLNRINWSRAGKEDALVLASSNGMTLLIILMINYLQKRNSWIPLPAMPTALIVLTGVVTLVGNLFARYRMRLITSIANRWLSWRNERGGFGERVLILGAEEGGQLANWILRQGAFRQIFTVVGMVDDNPAKQGMRIDGCWVLGGTGDISEIVRKHDVGVILFAIFNLQEDARRDLLKLCQIPDVRLIILDDIFGTVQTKPNYNKPN